MPVTVTRLFPATVVASVRIGRSGCYRAEVRGGGLDAARERLRACGASWSVSIAVSWPWRGGLWVLALLELRGSSSL